MQNDCRLLFVLVVDTFERSFLLTLDTRLRVYLVSITNLPKVVAVNTVFEELTCQQQSKELAIIMPCSDTGFFHESSFFSVF